MLVIVIVLLVGIAGLSIYLAKNDRPGYDHKAVEEAQRNKDRNIAHGYYQARNNTYH